MDIISFKATLQPYLLAFLDEKCREVVEVADNPLIEAAVQHAAQLVLVGGKRARPYVAYTMYTSLGGKNLEEILEVVVTFELFHMFALIHDDIIDRGELRHGLPTLHVFIEEWLQAENRVGDLRHIAEGQAMLVGDMFFNWAYQALTKSALTRTRKDSLCTLFQTMMDHLVVGEMLDVDVTSKETVTELEISRKTELKTAWYSFIYPMQAGAILAGGSNAVLQFCEDYGRVVGTAFQYQDDVLDVFGDAELTQKGTLQEIRNNQHTSLTQFIAEQASPRYRLELARLRSGEITPTIPRLRWLFESSGAHAHVTQCINQSFAYAGLIVEKSELPTASRKPWHDLISYIQTRQG